MSLLSLFLASLLGSPHCAAMCGGFVLAASASELHRTAALLSYNIGRLCTYLLLGALAGLLGNAIDTVGSSALGTSRLSALLLGGLLVLYALSLIFGGRALSGNGVISNLLHKGYSWISKALPGAHRPRTRGFLIGLFSTLLPCGWLYSFAALAGSSGHLLSGVAIMAVFWLGTLPLMVALGATLQTVLRRWTNELRGISAALLLVAGLFSIGAHFGFADHLHHSHPTTSKLFELFWPTRTDTVGTQPLLCSPSESSEHDK